MRQGRRDIAAWNPIYRRPETPYVGRIPNRVSGKRLHGRNATTEGWRDSAMFEAKRRKADADGRRKPSTCGTASPSSCLVEPRRRMAAAQIPRLINSAKGPIHNSDT